MEVTPCPNFPQTKDTATKSDKAITIGLTLAGIVAILILVGAVCASGQALVNSKPYCCQGVRRGLTKPLASVLGLHTKAWRLAFALQTSAYGT